MAEQMKDESLASLVLIAIVLIAFSISIVVVSAWPYQLNLTDGTLVDLNSSNNVTNNLTIYVIHTTVNQTYNLTTNFYNVTNITYLNLTQQNITCINCTMNYTYYTNDSDFRLNSTYFYNRSEIDSTFVRQTEMQTYKSTADSMFALKSSFDAEVVRVNNLTAISADTGGAHTAIWIVLVIVGLMSLVGLFLLLANGGE